MVTRKRLPPTYRSTPELAPNQRQALRNLVLREYLDVTAAAAHLGVPVSSIDTDLMHQLHEDFRTATSFLDGNYIRSMVAADDNEWRELRSVIDRRESTVRETRLVALMRSL
jgi:hypothetical protein